MGTFPADSKAGKAAKDGQALSLPSLSAVPSSEAGAQPAPALAGKGSHVQDASAPTALQVGLPLSCCCPGGMLILLIPPRSQPEYMGRRAIIVHTIATFIFREGSLQVICRGLNDLRVRGSILISRFEPMQESRSLSGYWEGHI